MAKLSAGDVVSVSSLVKRGVSNVEFARLLSVSEEAVRYPRKRLEAGAVDTTPQLGHAQSLAAPASSRRYPGARPTTPPHATKRSSGNRLTRQLLSEDTISMMLYEERDTRSTITMLNRSEG